MNLVFAAIQPLKKFYETVFIWWLQTGRGVLERGSAVGFCQEMAVVAAISQVKDCYKILKHIILPMYTSWFNNGFCGSNKPS